MKTTREIVFIDPAVADIPALIAGLQMISRRSATH